MSNCVYYYETSIGKIGIAENGLAITHIFFGEKMMQAELKETERIKEALKQLEEYFQGTRRQFDLTLHLEGTEFQQRVWRALQAIPYGETRSYKQIAEMIGNPKASRAVGMANNKNPIPIIIPCHRVVGANGSLVGYAGGLEIKQQLLNIEG
ncbi:MAG: methylated-DNA--[protein]-cysteine S-methyltransferase [Bacillaceae bacterium]